MASRKPDGPLRRGWTTGACATAGVTAAYEALLTGAFPDPVTITLPKGETPAFALDRTDLAADRKSAMASVIKDAGDDPDVTHGAEIVATVALGEAGTGVTFQAGDGDPAGNADRRRRARHQSYPQTDDAGRDRSCRVGAWWCR
jgi:cobalt-precorrin-5B (C1)-methyltransferase